MTAAQLQPTRPELRFGLLALAIYAVELLLVRSSLLHQAPDLATGAVTFDLVVFVPALFYLMVVRTKHLPALSVVPVFLASLVGASLVLPLGHGSSLSMLSRLVVPAELLLAGYVVVRAYRRARSAGVTRSDQRLDVVERFQSILGEALPIPPVARAIAYELAVLKYALLSWGSRPDVRAAEHAFWYHRKNGYAGVISAGAVLTLVETMAVHLVIQQWSSTAAWVLTAVSLYVVIWLVGHLQAVRLRPILLAPGALHVRVGLLWSVRVPYDRIAGVVHLARSDAPARSAKDYLHAVTLGAPRLLLELREPIDVAGPYGYTRHGVLRIGVSPDDRDQFAAELEARLRAAAD